MARPPAPPRIKRWRNSWYAFYYDHGQSKPLRRSCESMGARTKEERKALLKRLLVQDKEGALDSIRGGGVQTAYDTKLIDSLNSYLKDVAARVAAKKANPSADGLKESSAIEVERTVRWFIEWLESRGRTKLTTAGLSANILKSFLRTLATEKSHHGKREIDRSAATLNKHRRNLSSALHWIKELRPKQIPDFDNLATALKAQRVQPPEPESFSPDEMRRFFLALWEREQPGFRKMVSDKRRGAWLQTAQATCETPQSRVFLLLALTGMRLGEALELKWSDIDLQRGRITVQAIKTGRRRVLPLTGAPEGDVAPTLLETLKHWKLQAGEREFVLPHSKPTEDKPSPLPVFDRRAWESLGRELGLRRLTPQTLRQNMCSYLSSIGVPATVAAMWLGHSVKVAERFYRAQVLDRQHGESVEEAMGLDTSIERERAADVG